MRSPIWKTIDAISYVLVIIGALNWGLIGVLEFNLVAALFGEMSVASRIVYALVGAAAVYEILAMPGLLRRWAAPAPGVVTRERERMHV